VTILQLDPAGVQYVHASGLDKEKVAISPLGILSEALEYHHIVANPYVDDACLPDIECQKWKSIRALHAKLRSLQARIGAFLMRCEESSCSFEDSNLPSLESLISGDGEADLIRVGRVGAMLGVIADQEWDIIRAAVRRTKQLWLDLL